MRSDLVDLSLAIEGETEKAVRVRNLKDQPVWLPKSQVEVEEEEARSGRFAIVTMPQWLAEEKELV
jgi:hypothetical protein